MTLGRHHNGTSQLQPWAEIVGLLRENFHRLETLPLWLLLRQQHLDDFQLCKHEGRIMGFSHRTFGVLNSGINDWILFASVQRQGGRFAVPCCVLRDCAIWCGSPTKVCKLFIIICWQNNDSKITSVEGSGSGRWWSSRSSTIRVIENLNLELYRRFGLPAILYLINVKAKYSGD